MASSAYMVGRRSKAWTKVMCVRQREFVVGGWSEGSGGRSGQIGSLAVGWVDPERVPHLGIHSPPLRGPGGSRLSEFLLRHFAAAFKELASETSPYSAPRSHLAVSTSSGRNSSSRFCSTR